MEVKVSTPGGGKSAADIASIWSTEDQRPAARRDKVEWFTADHQAAGSEDLLLPHLCLRPDEVVAHLQAHGVAIEEGPGPGRARGTLRSVYCRDPDGSLIEISSYES